MLDVELIKLLVTLRQQLRDLFGERITFIENYPSTQVSKKLPSLIDNKKKIQATRQTLLFVCQRIKSQPLLNEIAGLEHWSPASAGNEYAFKAHSGRVLLYCIHNDTGNYGYYDIESDQMIEDSDTIDIALVKKDSYEPLACEA